MQLSIPLYRDRNLIWSPFAFVAANFWPLRRQQLRQVKPSRCCRRPRIALTAQTRVLSSLHAAAQTSFTCFLAFVVLLWTKTLLLLFSSWFCVFCLLWAFCKFYSQVATSYEFTAFRRFSLPSTISWFGESLCHLILRDNWSLQTAGLWTITGADGNFISCSWLYTVCKFCSALLCRSSSPEKNYWGILGKQRFLLFR